MLINYNQFTLYNTLALYENNGNEIQLDALFENYFTDISYSLEKKIVDFVVYLQNSFERLGEKLIPYIKAFINALVKFCSRHNVLVDEIISLCALLILGFAFMSLSSDTKINVLNSIKSFFDWVNSIVDIEYVRTINGYIEDLISHFKGLKPITNFLVWWKDVLVEIHNFWWDIDSLSSEGTPKIIQTIGDFYNAIQDRISEMKEDIADSLSTNFEN